MPSKLQQQTKVCTKCGGVKPFDEFHRNKRSRDGRNGRCKACVLTYMASRPDLAKTRAKRYRDAHPDRVRERNRRYRASNPERVKRYFRGKNLERDYGITLEDYEALLRVQGGRCAICNELPEASDGDPRRGMLHVDHDHATGRVRGLLCVRCNVGVGQFRDSRDFLAAAIRYLERV